MVDAHSLLRNRRPNVTTVMVQPTPYDVSEAECLAFTECIPASEHCSRSCVYEGAAGCRCSVESVCALRASVARLVPMAVCLLSMKACTFRRPCAS